MWLQKITPQNFRENNPIVREKILEIQRLAKHPLIIIMGASGVGKDTIINALLDRNKKLSKIKRATSREKKDRDADGDFEYFTSEEMEKNIKSGDILFAYDSHRQDWSKYWMLYEELKKLEEQPLITVMWQGGLQIINYVPIIICMTTRNEEDILKALSARDSDLQTQQNIKLTKQNLARFLNTPLQSQIIIENKTNNIEKTLSEIEEAIIYFEKWIHSDEQDILNSIFNSNIIHYIGNEEFDLTVFRETLWHYFRNSDWKIDKDKVAHLVKFMYTRKFTKTKQYVSYIRTHREEKNEKWIINERKKFYKETAQILYDVWFHEEAKKVMLQIWETTDPFIDQKEVCESEGIKSKIDISNCLGILWTRYTDSYIENGKIVFYHNGYAWWRNASKLAKDTLNLFLKTKGIKIERSTSMFWTFQVKLLEPYDGISYIECEIIKDRV
jgi:guanylate kinase